MTGEKELAQRAAAGDAVAFAGLVKLHEASVRRFLSRVMRSDGADDIAQEAFLKAWRMRASWRDEGSYGGWLLRIAWTTFLSSRRADARREVRDHSCWEAAQGTAQQPPEARLDLDRALARLGSKERAAAELCFGEGYSHSEAARILDLPLGTLKSLVARARTELVKVLEGEDG